MPCQQTKMYGRPPVFGLVGRRPGLQPKGARLGATRARSKLGTKLWLEAELRFPGNQAPISSPVSWKPGRNFQRGGQFWGAKLAVLGVQLFERGRQKEEKNCTRQPFVATPVDNRVELSMFAGFLRKAVEQ